MTFPGHPGPRGQHRRCTEPLSIARGSRISCSKFCRRWVDELWNLFFWHGSWIPQLFLCSSHRGSPKHLKTMIDWTILIILVAWNRQNAIRTPREQGCKSCCKGSYHPESQVVQVTHDIIYLGIIALFKVWDCTPPCPTRQVYSYFSWLGVSHMPVSIFTWYDPSKRWLCIC